MNFTTMQYLLRSGLGRLIAGCGEHAYGAGSPRVRGRSSHRAWKRVIRTEDRGETYVGTDWVGAASGSDLARGRANSKS